MTTKPCLVIALLLAATVVHATALEDNPCNLPDPNEYVHEPICTNLGCVPLKQVRAKQVEEAAKCNFERLQPPGAGLAPPTPAPAQGQM